jgi:2-hydroxy-3-keto-5-methylthiopentenyl-1-phosphate phosphatase
MPGPGAVVFLDFDGTITPRDVTDVILDTFADPAWLQLEDAWLSGQIGSRECLAAQMALVTASRQQVDCLLDEIGVDPGFATLLDACARSAAPVHIISDGFDYCIGRILGRPDLNLLPRLTDSQIVSSTLQPDGVRWRATFPHPPEPCAHGCATCKPTAMERLNAVGAVMVFVGDGISDRYAAARADIVFAKDKLAAYCENASIPYAPYDTLAGVATGIGRLLATGLPLPGSLPGKVSPAI